MDEPVFVVFNPHSGRGRGARAIAPVLEAFSRVGLAVEHGQTTRAGEEAILAQDAIARGARTIVAVGGDGTWSNTAGAILRSKAPVRLGLIPAGTGSDLAKSLGVPANDIPACVDIVRAGRTRAIDVGRVEERYFINVAGFGYDVAVIEDTRKVGWLSGSILYIYCALRQVRSFPGFSVEMAVDGGEWARRELLMLIVANAAIFGGGFRIAPGASPDDGNLDMVGFRNMGAWKRLKLMTQLRRGTHERAQETDRFAARSLRLRFDKPPAYETDGEWNQAASAELEISLLPAALPVLVA